MSRVAYHCNELQYCGSVFDIYGSETHNLTMKKPENQQSSTLKYYSET